eukprot:g1730.t1
MSWTDSPINGTQSNDNDETNPHELVDVPDQELIDAAAAYFFNHKRDELHLLILSEVNASSGTSSSSSSSSRVNTDLAPTASVSLSIDVMHLLYANSSLGHQLLKTPRALFPLFVKGAEKAQSSCIHTARSKFAGLSQESKKAFYRLLRNHRCNRSAIDLYYTISDPEPLTNENDYIFNEEGERLNLTNNNHNNNSGTTTHATEQDEQLFPFFKLVANGFGSVKSNVLLHFHDLPPHPSFCRSRVSSLRSSDVNHLLELTGTVTRTDQVKMLEACQMYRCNSTRCSHEFILRADVERSYVTERPCSCPMQSSNRCKSKNFTLIGSSRKDIQEIRLQDEIRNLQMGSIPRSITVILEDDLVEAVSTGDNIIVTGVPVWRFSPPRQGRRCNVEIIFLASHVRIKQEASLNLSRVGTLAEKYCRKFDLTWRNVKKPLSLRNSIIQSICPGIYGMFPVKLATLLTLIGGVGVGGTNTSANRANMNGGNRKMMADDQQDESDGPGRSRSIGSSRGGSRGGGSRGGGSTSHNRKQHRVRGQSHLLLVGDPGTGKSQFLRFAAKLIPRSVLTAGTGTSAAGLTCAAVKTPGSSGDWGLEAGALVLADRGVCCIDEFGSIRKQDKGSIHEAMEQQTLSVAKAGLVTKLNTRTTIIAATNPRKGNFDLDANLSVNTGLEYPLLSRFDLVMVLIDNPTDSWNKRISTFLLDPVTIQTKNTNSKKKRKRSTTAPNIENVPPGTTSDQTEKNKVKEKGGSNSETNSTLFFASREAENLRRQWNRRKKKIWSVEKLQAYIMQVQHLFQPTLSKDAQLIIRNYYTIQRQHSHHSHSWMGGGRPATVRLLESLVRLTQAHARLMWRHVALTQDAVMAIFLIECSSSALTGGGGVILRGPKECSLHSDASANPDADYKIMEEKILKAIGIHRGKKC